METIHQRIKRLRKARGLSIQAIATACGVKNQSARQWELTEPEGNTQPTKPREKYWADLAKVLEVSVPELIHGHVPAPSAKAPDGQQSIEAIAQRWSRFHKEILQKLDEFSQALATATADKHLKRFQKRPGRVPSHDKR